MRKESVVEVAQDIQVQKARRDFQGKMDHQACTRTASGIITVSYPVLLIGPMCSQAVLDPQVIQALQASVVQRETEALYCIQMLDHQGSKVFIQSSYAFLYSIQIAALTITL